MGVVSFFPRFVHSSFTSNLKGLLSPIRLPFSKKKPLILFPESRHQYICQFSKNLSTSSIESHMPIRIALVDKDRAR